MITRLTTLKLVLIALMLQGCQSEQTEHDSNDLKIYRHSVNGKPRSLDPIKSSSIYSNMLVVNIFDTLYRYQYLARPYQLTPNLAQAMPEVSDDGLTYVIKIKQGVKFHNHSAFKDGVGREVKAKDFVYSIKRFFDPKNIATGTWLWQDKIVGLDQWKQDGANYDQVVSGLRALDDYTIQIKLNKPYPQLIYSLAMGFSAITPREVVESLGAEFGSKPIGSGPFVLDQFNSEAAYLSRNTDFRQEPLDLLAEGYSEKQHKAYGLDTLSNQSPPFLDRLEVHFISEATSRWQSFTKGNEIHFTTVPKDQQNAVLLSKNPIQLHPQITDKYHHNYGVEAGFVYHGFNMADPSFGYHEDPIQNEKNKALRCAIRQTHDWNQKNQAFYFGLGYIFPGIIPPAVPEFDSTLSTSSSEVDRLAAKALLIEHGWNAQNLPEFEYHTTGGVLQKQFFEQMRGFLNQIDYPNELIKYQPYPSFGNFNQAIKNRKAPFFLLSWTLDYPDAENTLQLFYGPNQTPGSNDFNYQNPEFDALFEQSSVMLPSAERTALYQQMNQIVIDDCVVISGLSRQKINLWHKNVTTFPDREIVGGFHLRFVDVINE